MSDILLINILVTSLGCIRRTNEKITEDYDEIDRRDPPVFINNTRTKIVVAAGKTASLECRVMNIGDRTVRDAICQKTDIIYVKLLYVSFTNLSES